MSHDTTRSALRDIVSLPPCVNDTCLYSCNDDECKKAVEKGIPWPPPVSRDVETGEGVRERIIAAGDAVYEPTYPHTESESIAAAREALTIAKERLKDRTRPERVIIDELLASLSPDASYQRRTTRTI